MGAAMDTPVVLALRKAGFDVNTRGISHPGGLLKPVAHLDEELFEFTERMGPLLECIRAAAADGKFTATEVATIGWAVIKTAVNVSGKEPEPENAEREARRAARLARRATRRGEDIPEVVEAILRKAADVALGGDIDKPLQDEDFKALAEGTLKGLGIGSEDGALRRQSTTALLEGLIDSSVQKGPEELQDLVDLFDFLLRDRSEVRRLTAARAPVPPPGLDPQTAELLKRTWRYALTQGEGARDAIAMDLAQIGGPETQKIWEEVMAEVTVELRRAPDTLVPESLDVPEEVVPPPALETPTEKEPKPEETPATPPAEVQPEPPPETPATPPRRRNRKKTT